MPETKAVWLTREKTIIKKIRVSGGHAHSMYSPRGIYYSMVAKVGIMCFGWTDLPLNFFLFSNRICLIQLWHGTPLKSLNSLKGGRLITRILRFIFVNYLGRGYYYVISATESNAAIYSDIFSIDKNRVITLGQPRNNQLFKEHDSSFFKINHLDGKKVFLYAPTFRRFP